MGQPGRSCRTCLSDLKKIYSARFAFPRCHTGLPLAIKRTILSPLAKILQSHRLWLEDTGIHFLQVGRHPKIKLDDRLDVPFYYHPGAVSTRTRPSGWRRNTALSVMFTTFPFSTVLIPLSRSDQVNFWKLKREGSIKEDLEGLKWHFGVENHASRGEGGPAAIVCAESVPTF